MNGPILVFGGAGQLGHEVLALARARDIEAAGYNRAEADVTDFASVKAVILAVKPRLVLNAAAYTAVDRAETEREAAYAANAVGAETVARASALQQVPVIQISTDYVFDGTKRGAYVETDPIAPLGVYGKTKAAGEAGSASKPAPFHPAHGLGLWPVRREFSQDHPASFARSRGTADRRRSAGCPTATSTSRKPSLRSIAPCARGIEAPGTYHFAGDGATTWHGFASAIVEAQAQRPGGGRGFGDHDRGLSDPGPAARQFRTRQQPVCFRVWLSRARLANTRAGDGRNASQGTASRNMKGIILAGGSGSGSIP